MTRTSPSGKTPAMRYSYTFKLHPRQLPVKVWVGYRSEFKLDFPHLWTGEDRAVVWYPPGCMPVDCTAIAHEGVHLAVWGLETLPYAALRELIPVRDMCWGKGRASVKEEAMARMVDRHVANFYHRAKTRGLEIVGPKTTMRPRVVDDPGFYP